MPHTPMTEPHPPTSRAALDAAVDRLRDNARRFARTAVRHKIALLRECLPRLVEVAPTWAAAGCRAKGLPPDHGEEWMVGPLPTVRVTRLLADTLAHIADYGLPALGASARERDDGRLRVSVFPYGRIDALLWRSFSGYVDMQPGVTRDEARRRQAAFYQRRDPEGAVALVLGAGNVACIPPLDALSKMFTDGSACLLKMNPVNEWVGPLLERALLPLIEEGFLQIVYGGADVGAYLVGHPGIDSIHITGSDRTHDRIVWGPPGPEQARRKAAGERVCDKPITSELGNVSPVAIVPHVYTDDQLWFQAQNVASMVVNNASFNCNAAKLLVTARAWPQRARFLDLIARALGQVPPRVAYYPGALERYDALLAGRGDQVQTIGDGDGGDGGDVRGAGALPWALVRDVDADDDDPLLRTEPFCGILSEVCVGSADPVEFLYTATAFLNERVWGTLNATVIIHPDLDRDATVGRVLRRNVDALRYGTVGINHWPALGYGVGTLPWGGHASADLRDVQSGLGWVHNTFMLDGIDKAVIRGPITAWPKPVWFYDHPRTRAIAARMIRLEADPSWLAVPGVALAALTSA